MDTLGALALATEPPTDDLMKRAPVGRRGDFINNVMWRNILGQALYQFVVIWFLQTIGKWVFFLRGPNAEVVLNTLIFNTFVFCQVILLKPSSSQNLLASSDHHVPIISTNFRDYRMISSRLLVTLICVFLWNLNGEILPN